MTASILAPRQVSQLCVATVYNILHIAQSIDIVQLNNYKGDSEMQPD